MISILSKKIIINMKKYNDDWIGQEEVLEYSVIVLLEKSLTFLTIIGASFCFHVVWEGICTFLFLSFFRNVFGGNHATKFWQCYFISMAIIGISIYLSIFFDMSLFSNILISVILILISSVVFRSEKNFFKNMVMLIFFVVVQIILGQTFYPRLLLITLCVTILAKYIEFGGNRNEK